MTLFCAAEIIGISRNAFRQDTPAKFVDINYTTPHFGKDFL